MHCIIKLKWWLWNRIYISSLTFGKFNIPRTKFPYKGTYGLQLATCKQYADYEQWVTIDGFKFRMTFSEEWIWNHGQWRLNLERWHLTFEWSLTAPWRPTDRPKVNADSYRYICSVFNLGKRVMPSVIELILKWYSSMTNPFKVGLNNSRGLKWGETNWKNGHTRILKGHIVS